MVVGFFGGFLCLAFVGFFGFFLVGGVVLILLVFWFFFFKLIGKSGLMPWFE